MEQRAGWKERLADSSWVTVGWDWFMTLVGRAVEAVLWVTMALACYQLMPGAPPLPPEVKAGAFLTQFLALDAGGLGLYKLAEQQGLGKWASARVVSYMLMGITLVTVAYAGIEHAMQVDAHVTSWVEISLVIARSIMTVLYGPAVQSVKQHASAPAHAQQSLEELADTFNEQLEHLKAQLARSERRVQQQLANERAAVQENVQQLATSLHVQVAAVQESLHTTQYELAAVQAEAEEQSRERREPDKRVILHAVPRPEQQGEQGKFDARAFVFACLQENPTIKLADIEKQALAVGQELSQSSISRYRKQYFASADASRVASS